MWTDFVWRFVNTTPGQKNNIFWDFLLPDGTRSTDKQNKVLLESFREVCWGMLQDGGWYGRTFSVGSAVRMNVGVKELFCWMNYNGLTDLGELTREHWKQYLADLPTLIMDRERFYEDAQSLSDSCENIESVEEADEYDDTQDEDDEEARDFDQVLKGQKVEDDELALDDDDEITYGRVNNRVQTAYLIYAQRARVHARGFPCCDLLPFSGRKLADVTGEIARYVIKRIPPLPDEISHPLLEAALAWVDLYSTDILALQTSYLDARTDALARGVSRAQATKLGREAIADFSFTARGPDGAPWREKLESFNVLIQDGHDTTYRRVETLRYFCNRVSSAATTVLQYMVGLRGNEICGLEAGWDEQEGLPSCVVRKYSSSGLLEMFFVRGLVSKGRPSPQNDDWLLGCRPAGATYLPPPVRALCVLEKLFAPWRKLGERTELIVSFSASRGVAWLPSSIGRFTVGALRRGFKNFVLSELDVSRLPLESKRGEDLTAYIQTKGRNILPSQGRKTFAAYILDARSSLLPAVRQHFKHYSEATTESAYYPTEARLRNEIEAVVSSETINFFVSVIQGKKLEGRMGDIIAKYFNEEQFTSASTFAELVDRVADVVTTHDLRIYFSEYGNCFIRANPLESRCRAASETIGWGATTPDFNIRNPGMCAGCGCFAIDSSHRIFWVKRYEHYSSMFKRALGAGHEHEFAVHKARADQAKKVLILLKHVNAD
ncbi:hypothetical protein I6G56_14815 [Burkholderia humptydooensis]|uniref:Phage integrase family protein n=1 Tax=Burkholderia humptydooensis TaxID=430531 RepID=A0A7T2TZE8_9BURK|nr:MULTISPECIES: hypothetical protein [Burkholderia]QPS42847.1 hypothetical protein I6G56_14815 [Burkholderia humptydooensis]